MNFGSATGNGGGKRRVMVVAEPGREAAGALQWALSHAVLDHDDLILLHIDQLHSNLRKSANTFSTYFWRASAAPATAANGSGAGMGTTAAALGTSSSMGDMEGDFLEAMRAKCEVMQPKVKVQVERVEMEAGRDKDKAAAILAHCIMREVDLLVVGQQRRSLSILSMLGGGAASKDTTAEFLIEHSKCLCVGVQKKGQNAGYLLNTKSHKNFWLLA